MERMDRRKLNMFPLATRKHKLNLGEIAVMPDGKAPLITEAQQVHVDAVAKQIVRAKEAGKPVILAYGAHLIKNGLAPVVVRLIEEGWVTHVATNGAGSIHDWEFAYMGLSTEDVRENTAKGQFGTWDETGIAINLGVAVGGVQGLGYGESIGKMMEDDGLEIPSRYELCDRITNGSVEDIASETLGALADLLYLVTMYDLQPGKMEIPQPFKPYAVQYAAKAQGIPFTVHPGIGYDIIYTHPMNCGGAIGRGAVRDFLSYAHSVSEMGGGGVHLSVGSAIMAPMIFEKSLSMANNQAITEGHDPLSDYFIGVVDIADGGDWDWSQGEPPMDNPAYYLRFCKSFFRMGGTLDYICLDNRAFMMNLYKALEKSRFITY